MKSLNANKQSIIGSLLWKFCEGFTTKGLSLFVQIVLARLLLPVDFACIAIINALIHYLSMFVQAGLGVVVVQKKDLDSLDVSTLLTLSLSIALVLYTLLFLSSPYISRYYNVGDLVWPIRILSLSLFLYAFNSIQNGLLMRKMRFRTIFYRSLCSLPIAAAIGIYMAYHGYGLWALIAYNLSNILLTVFFMNLISDLRIKLGVSIKRAIELYSFSSKILVSALISNGNDLVRTLMIGKVYPPKELGYYDRAYNYANMTTQIVNQSITSVILPVLSRKQDDDEKMQAIARKAVSLSSFILIPSLVFVAIVSKSIILILLTDRWLPCSVFFSIFCLFRIPGILTAVDKQAYYAIGRSDIGLKFEIFLFLANIAVLIVLLNRGLIIIALGCLFVEYMGNIILMIISSKVYKYSLYQRFEDISKPIISTIVMIVPVYLLTYFIENIYLLLLCQFVLSVICYLGMETILKDKCIFYLKDRFLKNN